MPMVVWMFLEHYDFIGKTIRPFSTHEGSGLGRSIDDSKRIASKANVTEGMAIQESAVKTSKMTIENWIKS